MEVSRVVNNERLDRSLHQGAESLERSVVFTENGGFQDDGDAR